MATPTFATTQVKPGPRGHAALELDGQKCGLIGDLEGGSIYAEVVREKLQAGLSAKKHVGPTRYEEFSLQIGFAMSKAVYDWISSTWKSNFPRKSGSVVACDSKLNAQSQRKFSHALITETTIPALDTSSKEPGFLTLKFAPELVTHEKASGKVSGSDPNNPEKLLLPGNFKLEIDGLDCSKVAKIDSFTVKQTLARDDIYQESRHVQAEAGQLEFPNLRITFSEVHESSWADWFDDFIVKGNSGDDKEKKGKLSLLSPNKQVLAVIHFFNLGIFRIGHERSGTGQNQAKLAQAELYCERMEFDLG